MHSIAVAGHLCLDLAPRLGDAPPLHPGRLVEVGPLSVSLGGCVANTGGTLAGLGAAVTPIATIGGDELGETLRRRFRAAGLTDSHLAVSPTLATSYSLVLEQPGVDRAFWHHTGANDEFDGTEVGTDGHDLLHVGYPSLLPALTREQGRPLHILLARARGAGVTTSLDLAVVDRTSGVGALDWASLLEAAFAECDIASPSLDDLTSALGMDDDYSPRLVDELAERMIAQGVAVVAISSGRHGLHLRTSTASRLRAGGRVLASLADRWADVALTVPSLPVDRPATTNGAGDASTGGLLFALSRGASPLDAGALAAACAAVVIAGGSPSPLSVSAADPSLTHLFDA